MADTPSQENNPLNKKQIQTLQPGDQTKTEAVEVQKTSVKMGDKVHYVLPPTANKAGEHRAAFVTGDSDSGKVNLKVLLDSAEDVFAEPVIKTGPIDSRLLNDFVRDIPYDPEGKPGSWHQPE